MMFDYIAIMKICQRKLCQFFFASIMLSAVWGLAVQAESPRQESVGFTDQNRDGINDRFCDADGDGVNDVNREPYAHSFQFKDQNKDGINDLWADTDGDGVNDRLHDAQKARSQWVDMDGDGIQDTQSTGLRGKALMAHVLDVNRDGKNDITGEAYSGADLQGYRYGRVDEENGVTDTEFEDANGDGMNDRFIDEGRRRRFRNQNMDIFIDSDGDGIADDRGWKRLQKGKGQKGKK